MKTVLLSIVISLSAFSQSTWEQLNSGTTAELRDIYFTSALTGFAVGANGTILKTTNGGEGWIAKSSGTTALLYTVFFYTPTLGFVGGSDATVRKTTDGGETWLSSNTGIIGQPIRSIYFTSENVGYAVGGISNNGYINITTNGGSTWTQQTNPIPVSFYYSVKFIDNQIGYICGYASAILKTTNGGTNWVNQTVTTTSYLWSNYFLTANTGFTVGDIGTIIKTTNGGANWSPQTSGTTNALNDIIFTNELNGWAVGGNGTILYTTNGGLNWSPQTSGTTNGLNAVFFNEYNGWIVGGSGRILRYGIPQLAAWEKNINIFDAGAQNKIIYFAQYPTATDSLDVGLGEYELPPVPPAGVFDARFNLPTTPVIGSLKDYRNSADTSIVWRMSFQPGSGGYPITFNWTDGAFPALGNFFLRDDFGLVDVNMRTQNIYILTNAAITSLKIEFIRTIARPVNVLQGWNILSVPVNTLNMKANDLFPGATTYFFGYNNGYQITDTLKNGYGYWVKYAANQNFVIEGNIVDPPNVHVNNDWNIIGPFDYDVPVNDITSTPPNIVATYFFGYNTGYTIADTLKGGKGYWVRVNQNGILHLNDFQNSTTIDIPLDLAMVEIEFNINDGAGGQTSLKAGIDSTATDGIDPLLGEYEIPPLPPAGVFDARFNLPNSTISTLTDIRQGTDQGGFERVHEIQYQLGDGTDIIINYDFGSFPSEQVKGRLQDIVTGALIDTMIYGTGSYTVPNPSIFNKLKLTMIYDAPLPVELSSFTAKSIGNTVELNWLTATETNNKGFSIERKTKDEETWQTIGFVEGKGTIAASTQYIYSDKSLKAGIYNYQLKQIDFNGMFEYSKIVEVEVNIPDKFTLNQNYPNPFNPTTKISFDVPSQSNVLLKVYDMLGNEVATLVNENMSPSSYEIVFDASSLANGVYFYQLQAEDFVSTKKMILLK